MDIRKLLRMELAPARAWRAHAVEIGPTERLKLRRQMSAAADKKGSTSLSLFLEACGLEVEVWASAVQPGGRKTHSMDSRRVSLHVKWTATKVG